MPDWPETTASTRKPLLGQQTLYTTETTNTLHYRDNKHLHYRDNKYFEILEQKT